MMERAAAAFGTPFTKVIETKQPVSIEWSAKVIRCGCLDKTIPVYIRHGGEEDAPLPCPTPLRVEDLGVIDYYHRSAVRRAIVRGVRGWPDSDIDLLPLPRRVKREVKRLHDPRRSPT